MEQIAHGNLPRFDPHKHRDNDCIGLNGETSWIPVTDHFSRMKHGKTRVSKASPINWLQDFLEKHVPACSGKHVFMDQDGELHNNPEVRKLFTRFDYDIRPTGADASNQNAPVEQGHLASCGQRHLSPPVGCQPSYQVLATCRPSFAFILLNRLSRNRWRSHNRLN